MKASRFFILSLALAMALGFSSCRENKNDNNRNIIYALQSSNTYDGPMSDPASLSLQNDDEWDEQMESFLDYVQAGHTVTFFNSDKAQFKQHGSAPKLKAAGGPKKSNSIKTTSRDEMKQWCKRMEQEGLTVVMDYDDKTGTWNGYAYALPPSMAAQVKTYACNLGSDVLGDYSLFITADTVKNRIYVTSSLLLNDQFNLGVVTYNHFNPADSGFVANGNNSYLYMTSTLNGMPTNGMHYAVLNNSNFNFQNDAFTLVNLDTQNDPYALNNFSFNVTTNYETWVCEENGYSIVLHIDRSTVSSNSYSFTGYIVLQMDDPVFPFISGPVTIISDGAGSGTDCDENISLSYGSGDDAECGVELVSDQLVVWHFGDESWTFIRLM